MVEYVENKTLLKMLEALKRQAGLEFPKVLYAIIVSRKWNFQQIGLRVDKEFGVGYNWDKSTQSIGEPTIITYNPSKLDENSEPLLILNLNNIKQRLKIDFESKNQRKPSELIKSDSKLTQQNLRFFSWNFKLYLFHPKWGINFSAYLFKWEGKEK